MMSEDGKWYAFDDYKDDYLNERIAYWSAPENADAGDLGVLTALEMERDRRLAVHMLAWVERK